MNRPLIMALDVATVCGWARGRPGEQPTFGTKRFGKPGASDAAILADCLKWLAAELEPQPRPDILMLESLLPGDAKRGFTKTEVRDRLCQLQGICKSVAHCRGIYDIGETTVQTVRKHFIHHAMLKREQAKAEVVRVCRALGWQVENDNEGDACALWSYAVSLIDPEQSIRVSPLFNKALRISA